MQLSRLPIDIRLWLLVLRKLLLLLLIIIHWPLMTNTANIYRKLCFTFDCQHYGHVESNTVVESRELL